MTQNSIVKEKALVGAFSVITNLRIDLRFKLYDTSIVTSTLSSGSTRQLGLSDCISSRILTIVLSHHLAMNQLKVSLFII